MKNMIDGVNFHDLEAQKYWAPTASWTPERKKTEVHDMIFSGNYVGARKIDGAFYKFIKDEDGNMELLGRSKSVTGDYLNKIEWVPQLHSFFEGLPCGTCLIGEIYFPKNEGSNHVTTIMGCLLDKALARQEKGEKLHYYIFDVLAFNNTVLYKQYIEDRLAYLNDIKSNYYESDCIEFAQYFKGVELWNQLQKILAEGGEGVVITKCGTCYQPGKRPARQTVKVKKELQETIDVVIMGANAPTRLYTGKDLLNWQLWENMRTGERIKGSLYKDFSEGAPYDPVTKNYFNGWAGSLIIGLYDEDSKKVKQIGTLSGLTEEILENWRDYKGKIIEITGMEIFRNEDGSFSGIRHPKPVGLRPDKVIEDCGFRQVE